MSWLIIISGSAGQELKGNTKLKSSESEMQDINPLYTNGFILLVSYNKLEIVHCTYLGVSGYNFPKILYSFV